MRALGVMIMGLLLVYSFTAFRDVRADQAKDGGVQYKRSCRNS
jgi:hypothetical protein